MKKLFLFIFFTTLLYSCKKENVEDLVFPLTLESTEAVDIFNVRVFANGKEIFDPKVVTDFTANESSFKNPMIAFPSKSYIYFESIDSVRFDNEEHKFFIHKKYDQYLFLSSKVAYDDFHFSYFYSIQKYQNKTPTPFGTETIFLNKPIRVGYGTYSNLKVSMILYKFSTHPQYPSHWGTDKNVNFSGIIINEFNENFIKSLSSTDTLAIREFRMNYVKK